MDDREYTRRGALASGLVALGALAGCSSDGGGPGTSTPIPGQETTSPDAGDGEVSIAGSELASGFTSPVGVESPGDGRHYVVDQPGRIEVVADGEVREQPFLDLTTRTVDVSGYSERGVLGLAFHPDYADNGRMFVRYSAPSREGTPDAYSHTFVLAEFSADPARATAHLDSERTILEIPQPQGNHNAGAVVIGPDGYLYVATGDGGAANDQGRGHAADWYDAVDGGNGQDLRQNLLGSILRIDVDETEDGRPYAIPDDNPLVGEPGLAEQYAWGFRNPWRMSFGPKGRLFVADVGQNRYEEINVVEAGGNYGWNVREGRHCFQSDQCPAETPEGDPLIDPIIEYPHQGDGITGLTVIGGYLYDGAAIDSLRGRYVFADWLAGGEVFVAEEGADGCDTRSVPVQDEFGTNVLSFGQDDDGELLVCTTEEQGVTGETGAVYRLTSPAA